MWQILDHLALTLSIHYENFSRRFKSNRFRPGIILKSIQVKRLSLYLEGL
jgi:hypothetical protein